MSCRDLQNPKNLVPPQGNDKEKSQVSCLQSRPQSRNLRMRRTENCTAKKHVDIQLPLKRIEGNQLLLRLAIYGKQENEQQSKRHHISPQDHHQISSNRLLKLRPGNWTMIIIAKTIAARDQLTRRPVARCKYITSNHLVQRHLPKDISIRTIMLSDTLISFQLYARR